MSEKSKGQLLQEELLIDRENGGLVLSDEELAQASAFCEEYKEFLDAAKTEREAVEYTIRRAEQQGYVPFDPKATYKAGDKVYCDNRGKSILLAVIGSEPIENGVNIAAAHIDSPRLDLKPRPLYEEGQVALFKTHYYGGIKKYQWTAIPLALHGVIIKADGEKVKVNIGEDAGDPVFCVTDLLPHLAVEQMKRSANEIIRGEELNVIVGLHPFRDDKASEKVKLNIIRLLNEKYGIVERDFLSAELEVVPAYRASDVGLDRSMVGSYGQDDRVCAYTALKATLDCKAPKRTMVTILADKEETGSDGNTGLKSSFFKYFIADLANTFGVAGRTVLSHSKCLSADVNAAFDPTFSDVNEKRNTAYCNYGVVITKYTGSRGKAGTSDASAEFVNEVTRLLDRTNVLWQHGELGKVDAGGGGTVAAYLANLNIDVVDVGVPVLSMHAPFELTAKVDIYSAYRAFYEFYAQ
ncbi:MAG: aminopeptidase [Massilioclostridium sp.]|nr:aminopeptidase [Massilioclostridium sp.]